MRVEREFENKLLKRKELELFFENSVGLKKLNVAEDIAKKFKVNEELIVIEKMKNHFGSRNVLVYAYIYENKDSLNKLTSPYMKKRMEKYLKSPEKGETIEQEA
jgi:ribosomal protein S24E